MIETPALDEFKYQGVRCQGFGWVRFRFLVATGNRPTIIVVVELEIKMWLF